jgi:hypothetical protein
MKYLIKFCSVIIFLNSCQLFSPKPESEAFYCKINGSGYRPEKKTLPVASANPLRAEWNKKGRFNINADNNVETVNFSLKVEQIGLSIKTYDLDTINSFGNYYYNSSLLAYPLNIRTLFVN